MSQIKLLEYIKKNLFNNKFKKKPLKLLSRKPHRLVILYVFICIVLGAWYILQNDILFFTDIARDFLLMAELVKKKLILIGPRASAIPGLFHGPLWIYLNIPAFLLGNGNPVVIGWFWILLVFIYLATSYYFAEEITSKKTASIFVMLLAGHSIGLMYGVYNPVGAMLFMPALLYTSIKYQTTLKKQYFIGTLLITGIITQLQMAVGVPLIILSVFWHLAVMYRSKSLKHLIWLPVILLPLSTFILFDLRHDLVQFKAVMNFLANKTDAPYYTLKERLPQRIYLLLQTGIGEFDLIQAKRLSITAVLLILGRFTQRKTSAQKKDSPLLAYLLFTYVGFYIISLFFNGQLHLYYWSPITPVFLLMLSIALARYSRIIIAIFMSFVLSFYISQGISHARESSQFVGKVEDSWQFQDKLASYIFDQDEAEFGYFIFTPDIYAYESKAAMAYYTSKNPDKKVSIYKKRPTTYLIVAPDPGFRPDITSAEWKRDRVKIFREPDETIYFDDNYKIEKYNLTQEEILVAEEETIHDWIYFR